MEKAAEAAREGNLHFFQGLDPADLQRMCKKTDEDGRSLLHSAAAGGNLPVLNFILEHDGASSNVNRKDEDVSHFFLSEFIWFKPTFNFSTPPSTALEHCRAGRL